MMKPFLSLVVAAAALAQPLHAADAAKPAPSPAQIVEAALAGEWVRIAAADLLVMDLAEGARGQPRRVVIQLMPPPFSQGWVGNLRKLAAAHWWDGLSVYRVQDNYVAQWGDGDGEDAKLAKALPPGLAAVPESEYVVPVRAGTGRDGQATSPAIRSLILSDPYVRYPMKDDDLFERHGLTGFHAGWPVAMLAPDARETASGTAWPVHCYGMVGVARDLSPNTGTGAELYAVIGHAPRHLDRNIALVGRVIEGIEHLSSLPRAPGMGVYADPAQRTPILTVRLGNEVMGLPAYEYLSTDGESFAGFARARASRRDPFFIVAAGGADICNVPVPVRRVK